MSPEARQALISLARTQNESITGIEDAVTEMIDSLEEIKTRASSQSGEMRALHLQLTELKAEVELARQGQENGFARLERQLSRWTPVPPRK